MISEDSNETLNRLLAIHNRSLPMYLSYLMPALVREGHFDSTVFDAIVADHKRMVDRVGELIVENEGRVDLGEFPMSYTALHDVSFEFLRGKMIAEQRSIIRQIEACVDDLRLAPMYQAVAQEALGMAKGHLESLQELAA